MIRYAIIAIHRAEVLGVRYLPGEYLTTPKGRLRTWKDAERAYSFLHTYIQGPTEEAGWRVTVFPG